MIQLVGLTGGIASGKSTVSKMLRELGAEVIDADQVYHDLIAPQDGTPSPLAQQIGDRFKGALLPTGEVDRASLGKRVFGNPEALSQLGEITHPAVAMEVAKRVAALAEQGVPQVIYDVPLLYERNLQQGLHRVVVVWVPRELQLARLMARDGIDEAAAERKLASQMPLDRKRDMADHVIDNSGSHEQTRAQVEALWRELTGSGA